MNVFINIDYPSDPEIPKVTPKKEKQLVKSPFREKAQGTPSKKPKKKSCGDGFRWSAAEQKRYLHFLVKNKQIFDLGLEQKRKLKPHVLMAKCIKSKDQLQCRSHHQKMVQKFSTIESVIHSLRQELESARLKRDGKGKSQQKVEIKGEKESEEKQQVATKNQDQAQKQIEGYFQSSPLAYPSMEEMEMEEPIRCPLLDFWSFDGGEAYFCSQ